MKDGGAMNAPGEDAAISRDSLPLASRGSRVVERVRGEEKEGWDCRLMYRQNAA